jgi:hypothetical protein
MGGGKSGAGGGGGPEAYGSWTSQERAFVRANPDLEEAYKTGAYMPRPEKFYAETSAKGEVRPGWDDWQDYDPYHVMMGQMQEMSLGFGDMAKEAQQKMQAEMQAQIAEQQRQYDLARLNNLSRQRQTYESEAVEAVDNILKTQESDAKLRGVGYKSPDEETRKSLISNYLADLVPEDLEKELVGLSSSLGVSYSPAYVLGEKGTFEKFKSEKKKQTLTTSGAESTILTDIDDDVLGEVSVLGG